MIATWRLSGFENLHHDVQFHHRDLSDFHFHTMLEPNTMSKCRLKLVRRDANVAVLTEHTDRIHPRVLSEALLARFGKDHFKISLRKNIYIIYIDIRRAKDDRDEIADVEALEAQIDRSIGPKTYEDRLLDIKLAEKILRDARSPNYSPATEYPRNQY
ncbi:hypothetical protein BDV96DRAFT_308952 [Lophiotrema nucula]|uniref:Uncharacterized protein n=1 Tax=Lophiotrema nucula TaxID=690887 RepID=A0A6A5YLK6_9PLEO|nr:hypothetical protein BDV96DRAFT_308952 [Lophiotrema nucula]